VRAGDDAEAANDKYNGKINARYSPKKKRRQREHFRLCEMAVDENIMMMQTEKYRGDNHRKQNRVRLIYAKYRFKEKHKDANQNESENQFFINSGSDSCDDIHCEAMMAEIRGEHCDC